MLQKLPVNNFELIKDNSQFNEDFLKNTTMKRMMKDIFLKLMFNVSKNWFTIFTWKNKDWKIENIVANLHDKTE